jgi:hypothetical protein
MAFRRRSLPGTGALLAALCSASAAHAAVTISSAATQNMSCTSGVCTPTAADAVLNVTDLTTMLGIGNVVVNTGSGSLAQQVQNIVVSAGFNWANVSSLTLDAYDSVTVNRPVAVNGSGAVVLTTDDGGTKGALSFGTKGSISFLSTSNSVTINRAAYTLVSSVTALTSAIAAKPDGHFALANGYNASQDGTYSSTPVTTTLTGTVQGLGNSISNLSITHSRGKAAIAMFNEVGTTGAINNLRLNKITYNETNRKYAGAFGLVAENAGYLFGDQVSGTIHSRGDAGRGEYGTAAGLVGGNDPTGTIVSSSADVRLVATFSGGLVSWNSGTVSLSHAGGDAEGESGGLVWANEGLISQSYATGTATVGGLVDINEGDGTYSGVIENSYSTATVTGGVSGGFVGNNAQDSGSISDSYSSGTVAVGDGGFACEIGGEVSDDYWDTTTSGTTYGECENINIANVSGLTGAQLQSGLPAGFDPTVWAENPSINNGLPYLIANPPQ